MEVILVSIALVGIAFVGLGINIFFRKGGKFPETEIGKNRKMHEIGISCVKCDEFRRYREAMKKRSLRKINPAALKLDTES